MANARFWAALLGNRPAGKLARALAVLAIAYPATLALIAFAFWFPGFRPWQIELGLYAPRVFFLAPLPLFLVALALLRLYRLLWTQLAALFLVLFPLMGLVLPWPSGRDDTAPVVRVLSYNANSAYGGFEHIAAQIDEFSPDIVIAQELFMGSEPLREQLKLPHVEVASEFLVASRFPLRPAPPIQIDDLPQDFRVLRVIADSPLGPLALYNVHPVSPRYQFYRAREGGFRQQLLSGRLFSPKSRPEVQSDSELRVRQIDAIAKMARLEKHPVVIAGDTNLPALSPALRHLSDFDDGFEEAGWGFGYTYPTRFPWMRLDRIFASRSLKFVNFEVGRSKASDHHCVVADLQRRQP